MRTVFAIPVKFAQQLRRFESVTALDRPRPIETGARLVRPFAFPIHDHVETVEGVEQTLGAAQLEVERLDGGRGIRDRQSDPIQLAELIGGDEPSLGVERHRDPRPLFLGHPVNAIDLESGQDGEIPRE